MRESSLNKTSLFIALFMFFSLIFPNIPTNYAEAASVPTDLIFSEYVEGNSNNKAIELYNGTGQPINLSAYTIELYANGAISPNSKFTLASINLGSGKTYVIVNTQSVADLKSKADLTNGGVTTFNGDDALVLKKGTAIIDSIGQVGKDPGTAWGTTVSTLDQTLVRKSNITSGDTNPTDSFDPALEWNGHPTDTFTYLGSHTMIVQSKVATVIADVVSGGVPTGTSVGLSTTTANATIYYTTNESTPTTESTIYTEPIVINQNTTIKAFATADGSEPSDVATFTYTVLDTTAPDAPVAEAVTSADVYINGVAEAGSKVIAEVNNVEIGYGIADETDRFLIPIPKQKVGTIIELTAVDTSLNVSATTEVIVINSLPVRGFLDTPLKDQTIRNTLNVSGWFLDESGVSKIEVLVDDIVVGEASYGYRRSDVSNKYPEYNNNHSGFNFSLNTSSLEEGPHTLVIREYNNLGRKTDLSKQSFFVTHIPAAIGYIDTPQSDQSIKGYYNISGWFLDGNGVSKIEVIIDGVVVGEATYGLTRLDVFNAFPEYQNKQAGFKYLLDSTTLTEGEHTLVIKEYNSKGETTTLSNRNFWVSHKFPAIGFLDLPQKDLTISGIYNISGWFLDGNGVSKIEVLVDNIVVGEATYGLKRQDVYNVFPEYKNSQSGFKYLLDTTFLSNGQHTLVIREYDSEGNQTDLQQRSFYVSNSLQ
jgi:hypothetical protein